MRRYAPTRVILLSMYPPCLPLHHFLLVLSTKFFFFFQAEDGIRDLIVTGVQTCALPISERQAFHFLGDDVNIPDEAAHVIAEEVKSLTFSYFDGSQWQDTWDSTQPGADGATPKGPPLAIAIVIGIPAPGAERTNSGNLKQYRHVVAIPSAHGATQPNTTTSP